MAGRPDFDGTEATQPGWADGQWGRPSLEDFPSAEDGVDFEDLPERARASVAGHFIEGDASAPAYGDLGYPVVNPATGSLNRFGVLAARQRASAQNDTDVESIADDLWAEHFMEEKAEVDLAPPDAVVNAAQAALDAKERLSGEIGDCGTGRGEQRARQIVDGDLAPADFLTRENGTPIPAYLDSHSEDVTGIDQPPTEWSDETWADGCGPVQYALWGGTATGTGLEWAESTKDKLEQEMQKDCGCTKASDGPDVFTDPMAAQERADEIGCEGIHVHEKDGETVFMPCATHEMWQDMTQGEMDKALGEIESILRKASAEDLSEGDLVEWDSAGGTAYGRVQKVAMGETVSGSLEPDDTEHETSEDNPGVIIELVDRMDGDIVGRGDTVFHRPGELRMADESDVPEKAMHGDEEEEEEEEDEMKSAVGERRVMSFETKQFSTSDEKKGEMTFSAYGAVFGNKDRGGDILRKGAFKQTIDHNDGKFPLIADHELKLDSRLGVAYAEEDDTGVKIEGHINTDAQAGREVASHIRHAEKHGLSLGMSFGYEVIKDDYNAEKDARELKEVRAHEFTVTQIPMNPEAEVTAVKQLLSSEEKTRELARKIAPILAEDERLISALKSAVCGDDSAPNAADSQLDAEFAEEMKQFANSI